MSSMNLSFTGYKGLMPNRLVMDNASGSNPIHGSFHSMQELATPIIGTVNAQHNISYKDCYAKLEVGRGGREGRKGEERS